MNFLVCIYVCFTVVDFVLFSFTHNSLKLFLLSEWRQIYTHSRNIPYWMLCWSHKHFHFSKTLSFHFFSYTFHSMMCLHIRIHMCVVTLSIALTMNEMFPSEWMSGMAWGGEKVKKKFWCIKCMWNKLTFLRKFCINIKDSCFPI